MFRWWKTRAARRKMRWAVRRVNQLKIRTSEIGEQVILTDVKDLEARRIIRAARRLLPIADIYDNRRRN